eukprot:jgi/Botrbrau1/11610/Bobra.0209s0001.1
MRTLPGTYRRIVHRPNDLTWRLLSYADPDQDLVPSDLTDVLKRSPPTPVEVLPGEGLQEGRRLALELCFSLPPGSYATMLVRELTKQCSSKQHAKDLTLAARAADASNEAPPVA